LPHFSTRNTTFPEPANENSLALKCTDPGLGFFIDLTFLAHCSIIFSLGLYKSKNGADAGPEEVATLGELTLKTALVGEVLATPEWSIISILHPPVHGVPGLHKGPGAGAALANSGAANNATNGTLHLFNTA
jgi:hypothetical protein